MRSKNIQSDINSFNYNYYKQLSVDVVYVKI